MAKRPCLDCGAPTTGTRCPTHEAAQQRARNDARTHYHGCWPALARQAIATHRALYGDWCPGWRRPSHPATDLTADHIDPRSLAAGVRVLCRSCNSSRGNRRD